MLWRKYFHMKTNIMCCGLNFALFSFTNIIIHYHDQKTKENIIETKDKIITTYV